MCEEENLTYYYNGTSCCVINIEKCKGDMVIITNDYGEIMYKGYSQFIDNFINDLKLGLFA